MSIVSIPSAVFQNELSDDEIPFGRQLDKNMLSTSELEALDDSARNVADRLGKLRNVATVRIHLAHVWSFAPRFTGSDRTDSWFVRVHMDGGADFQSCDEDLAVAAAEVERKIERHNGPRPEGGQCAQYGGWVEAMAETDRGRTVA